MKKIDLKKFSQKGFGMVQALILAGLVAGGSLVATRVINDLKLAQRGVSTRDDLEVIHSSTVSTLQDSAHCTASLQDYLLGSGAKKIVFADSTPTVYTDNLPMIQEGETYMGNSLKVSSIVFTANSVDITYVRLKTDVSHRLGRGYGGQDIKKSLAIVRIPDPTIDVGERCYLDVNSYNSNTVQEFCSGLGSFMAWDAVNKKCVLNTGACPVNQAFTGVDSHGASICRNINFLMNADKLFEISNVSCSDRTHVKLVVDPVTQKIKMECLVI